MDSFPVPYAVRWYLMSRYWYYVGTEHRQNSMSSSSHRHHMPEGAYQIMGTTLAGRGAQIDVFGSGATSYFRYALVPPGVEGTQRTGVATIYIPVGGGHIECKPIDATGGAKPEDELQTPLVMQILPLESFKP